MIWLGQGNRMSLGEKFPMTWALLTCEIQVYLHRWKMRRSSSTFKICFGKSVALFLPRLVGFCFEVLGIYLGNFRKLNIRFVKRFKWSKFNNCFLLLFNFCYKVSFYWIGCYYLECIFHVYSLLAIRFCRDLWKGSLY